MAWSSSSTSSDESSICAAAAFSSRRTRALGARDGDDVLALGHHPGERKLGRRDVTGGGKVVDAVGEMQVLLERVLLEARIRAPPVVLGQVGHRADLPREEAATQRRVRDQTDAELPQRVEDTGLGVARPQRILALHGRDRMGRVRPPDRLRRCFGQAEVAHLPLLDQLGHRADRLLDRHARIDAMLVEEVDVPDPETLERALACAPDVLRAPVHAPVPGPGTVDREPELRRDLEPLAAARNRAPHQLLVRVRPVDLGRVQERDPEVQRAVDRLEPRALVAAAVGVRHAHAPEPLRRHLEPLASKRPSLHQSYLQPRPSSRNRSPASVQPDGRLRSRRDEVQPHRLAVRGSSAGGRRHLGLRRADAAWQGGGSPRASLRGDLRPPRRERPLDRRRRCRGPAHRTRCSSSLRRRRTAFETPATIRSSSSRSTSRGRSSRRFSGRSPRRGESLG